MKKAWIWILMIGLLLCVITALAIMLILSNYKLTPLAPAATPAPTVSAAAPPPTEAPEPGQTAAAGGAPVAAPAGTDAPTDAAGETPAPEETAGLPGLPIPTPGESSGMDQAKEILTETYDSIKDGSFDPYDALGDMGDAAAAAGQDAPFDVSGATDALRDAIGGVTDGHS